MGSIVAKIDNQDKVISLEQQNREGNNLDLVKMKDYINKYGFIKVEVDPVQLDNYWKQYITKYFKHNEKEILQYATEYKMAYSMSSIMLSSIGLIVLSKKEIEKFISGVSSGAQTTSAKPAATPAAAPGFLGGTVKSVATPAAAPGFLGGTVKSVATPAAAPGFLGGTVKAAVMPPAVAAATPGFLGGTVKAAVMPPAATPIKGFGIAVAESASPSIKIISESQVVTPAIAVPTAAISEDSMYVILPKVYFSSERNNFLDLILAGLKSNNSPNIQTNIKVFEYLKQLLNKINENSNPDIKIVNILGLLIRISTVINLMKIVNYTSKYTEDEKMNIIFGIITDNMEDIPYDECLFYNTKLNFIKYNPNICTKAKEEKEIRLKNLYQTKCPIQEVSAKCPIQEVCAKCPIQEVCDKCPVCPTPEASSNIWKYTSAVLLIVVVILIIMFLLRKCKTKSNLKKLTEIN